MKLSGIIAIVSHLLLAGACGTDAKQSESCQECREQNAPLADVITNEENGKKSADQKPLELEGVQSTTAIEAGAAPSALNGASEIEVTEDLKKAIAEFNSREQQSL